MTLFAACIFCNTYSRPPSMKSVPPATKSLLITTCIDPFYIHSSRLLCGNTVQQDNGGRFVDPLTLHMKGLPPTINTPNRV